MNTSGRWRYLRAARLVARLPTYARLVWGLMRDPRVPLPLKGLLVAAAVYLLTPLDLIPDVIPILGQADDLTVLMLVLDLFIRNAPPEVTREHMERARTGQADLDRDLAKLRETLGSRYDTIRDNLPGLLERYGELRDRRGVQDLLARWRDRRLADSGQRQPTPRASEPGRRKETA
jgi:uncharacterized membrane protein YkvA (DUF1232 family)